MRDGVLPALVLCAALGLLSAFAPRRALLPALLALIVTAIAISALPVPTEWRVAVGLACWIAAVVTALSVHLPRGVGYGPMVSYAAIAGLIVGAVVAISGQPIDLAISLPGTLVAVPAILFVNLRWTIVVKVIASWLVAVALLSAGLTVAQGPAAGADHLD